MGTRAPVAVAGLLLCLPLTAACGTSGATEAGAGGTAGPEREWAVAADPHATASEIVAAGAAADVATTGDRTVITYLVQSDDDEGPQQGAWRMYDAHGARVADGTLGTVREQGAQAAVRTTTDGFLLENYTAPALLHLAEDGSATAVPVHDTPAPTRAGDLLVSTGEYQSYYRPEGRRTGRLAPLPSDNPQSVVLDGAGTVWMLRPWQDAGEARVAFAAGGTAPWRTEAVPIDAASYPILDLTSVGDRVLLFTGHDGIDEYPVIDGLWQRATTTSGTWSRVTLNGVRISGTLQPRVQSLPDGRLLITGDEGPGWLQDGRGWREVPVPGGDAYGLQVAGPDWYLLGPKLRVSHDEGRTWAAVPR